MNMLGGREYFTTVCSGYSRVFEITSFGLIIGRSTIRSYVEGIGLEQCKSADIHRFI